MLTVVVGLAGALLYGSGDFFGGLSSRRIGAVTTTAISAATGLLLLLILSTFLTGRSSPDAWIWGAISGVCGTIAIALLYACLAIGPMSILSPLTAVVGAIVPLCYAAATGSTIGALGWGGLALALVAIVLVGFVRERGAVRPSLRGILMAIGSGAFIGGFFITISKAPDDAGLIPLIANRSVNTAIMALIAVVLAVIAAVRRRRTGTPNESRASRIAVARAGVLLATCCGCFDGGGNAMLLWGIHLGDLPIMSVLTAMYPIGTILLARFVLKERIAPLQYVGLGLAIVASALLALD